MSFAAAQQCISVRSNGIRCRSYTLLGSLLCRCHQGQEVKSGD